MSSSQVPGSLDPYAGYIPETADVAGAGARAQGHRFPRPSRKVGTGAGILAVSLSVYSVAGVIWGLFRPTYTVAVRDGESASVEAAPNVEFTSFIWFVVFTGLLGCAMALVVFIRSVSTRGPLMLLWVTVVAFLGSLVFLLFGDMSAGLLHRTPADFSRMVGETFTVVPPMSPGVGLAAAPFLAVCTYWCAAFVTPSAEPVADGDSGK
ncbi:hypothetical protein [Corynebacterium pacaense]|uniref:hypothetical protein n=1 Tax=Corynebacterium pacaense TaxID=1816684 RepID=UPI0009BAABD7|nr:hypothetical protein [Corynebacterium pacaense]